VGFEEIGPEVQGASDYLVDKDREADKQFYFKPCIFRLMLPTQSGKHQSRLKK